MDKENDRDAGTERVEKSFDCVFAYSLDDIPIEMWLASRLSTHIATKTLRRSMLTVPS